MSIKYLFPLLAIFTQLADGRMNETRDELIKRYGRPVAEDKFLSVLFFERNGYRFEASLLDGVTQCFSVSKVDGSPLSKDEVKEFIAKNKGNYSYKQTIDDWGALRNIDCDYMVSDDKQHWVVLKSASPHTIERMNAYINVNFMTSKYRYWITQTINQSVQQKERDRIDNIKKKTEGF
jgi:uncharacterized protein (DUF2164 family)